MNTMSCDQLRTKLQRVTFDLFLPFRCLIMEITDVSFRLPVSTGCLVDSDGPETRAHRQAKVIINHGNCQTTLFIILVDMLVKYKRFFFIKSI